MHTTEDEARAAGPSDDGAEPVELTLSIVIPVVLGAIGYYFTRDNAVTLKKDTKYSAIDAASNFNYGSLLWLL